MKLSSPFAIKYSDAETLIIFAPRYHESGIMIITMPKLSNDSGIGDPELISVEKPQCGC